MKNLVSLFLLVILLGSLHTYVFCEETKYPDYIGYVNDYGDVIGSQEEAKISSVISAVEKTTTSEIAVVTVPSVAPLTVELYAVELFERWGIGKKGKDNGVLILLALKEREGRIEVGYGLEGALPDSLCSEISRKVMVPHFKNGEFGTGLLAGTMVVAEYIGREYNVDLRNVLQNAGYREVVPKASPARSILSTILTLFFFIMIFGLRMGLFGFLLFGRRGYWGGGGHTGTGGFGGGFGGFGGGMSGGGGASFRW